MTMDEKYMIRDSEGEVANLSGKSETICEELRAAFPDYTGVAKLRVSGPYVRVWAYWYAQRELGPNGQILFR